MARYGQRPENALKRANEFIEVGKPARALDTLYEVFKNKKWACNWSETVLEPIMFKYLDLCVELKKSHIAKEGLFQYRNMFQSVNVGSLENVIRGYLRTAEERTESAREQSQQAVIDVEDLEMISTPESILLSAVSGEDAQDRSDRTILTPWVKFLWESYCQCLELLRTNAHVETLYHDIARMAFNFCLKYNRKTEFRKLCDKLRKHLEDIGKLPAQVSNVSISKPETQQLNLDTRLVQLDSAIHMELWQEAYKATEDIHGLMNMSKKSPVPKTMANYYQKLALVFWKANNCLFHAAALFKLFQLSKEMKKNMSPEELQRMACRVLLATLSIPLPSAHPEFDRFIETDKSPLEKAQRLATLLGLPQPPSRASLLKDIVRVNVVGLAAPQLQDLYSWLEVEFDPLNLCARVQSVVESLQAEENSQLVQYTPALQDVTLVRLIRQVSQVYQTVHIARLIELARFTDKMHLERLLVDCVRHNDMQIRIDHGAQCIHFGMDLAESQREDHPEGPTLQSMPSEQVRNQLINMACVLTRAINSINPAKKRGDRENLRHKMVERYHATKSEEHALILKRHKIIEDRKEYLERINTLREEEAARRQEELARLQMMQEQKRLAMELEERDRKRQENEIQQIKDRHLKEKMQQISQTAHGQKILKKLDEDALQNMDAEQITAREMEELQKERRDMLQKLKSQEKKMDYFIRAMRIEEIPLLQKSFEENQIKDRAFWEQQEKERIQKLVEERELAVQNRERLARMYDDKEEFLSQLMKERNSAYEDKMAAYKELFESERKKRLAERQAKRKSDRREKYYRLKREEEERKEREEREEAERKEREEREERERKEREEREERERKEREEREEEEKKRKEALDRQAKIQQERMEEIERRARERERDAEKPAPAAGGGGAAAGGGGGSSWRRGDAPARGEREDRRDDREDRRDAPRGEDSAWRRGGAGGAGGAAGGAAEPSAKEAWRPARLREGGDWRSRDAAEREAAREGDAPARDSERGGRFERDREAPRDRGFDREGGRGGYDRDREGGRGGFGDRDREGGRGGFGDRDRDRGYERDRGGFGGGRDRPSDMGSWRRGPAPGEDDDRRGAPRRDDRRDAPKEGGGGAWRKDAPAAPRKEE